MRALVLAATAAVLLSGPAALAAAKAPAAAPAKGTSKMSQCGAKWTAMSPADKDKYAARAKGMKSKKGNAVSGYNVWTGECMKKA